MATVRKNRGKWQVQIRRKGYGNLTRTFTHKADATAWAASTERQVERRGLSADPKMLDRMTVSDVVRRFLDTVVPLRRGKDNEIIVINAFLRNKIANTKLSELGTTHFASYRDERLRSVKPATINRELGLIQHIFEVARKDWNIPLLANPVKEIRKPKPDQPRERRLRSGERERLIEACKKSRNPFLRPVLCFALETAMRRGELLSAKWRDVNWKDRTLRIPVTKNGCARTIPLSHQALCILASLGNAHASDAIIFPLSCEAVKLAWKRLVTRASIEDLHFHDLRHEAVSGFFELGLTMPEVALISGHKDPRMLFRYTHLKAEDVAQRISHLSERGGENRS